MIKKILFFSALLSSFYFSFGQCSYTGTPLSQVGIAVTFCIDNTNSQTSGTVNAGQYILVNVVSGFKYTFSVGNVFTGTSDSESLTILKASDNSLASAASFSAALNGTSVTWTATFSGQVKVLLSRNCTNDATAGGAIIAVLNTIGNNFDAQNVAGTNNWVGHVYNYLSGSSPGGIVSPTSLSTTTPFSAAEYVGYYTVPTEIFADNFGGSNACFPVQSNGQTLSAIYADQFAVRYRMKSTRAAGCYLVTIGGDDGVRLYVDGVLVASQWYDQGPTAYTNILVYLNGNSTLVLDFYENGGGNDISFSITPFSSSSNTISSSSSTVCSGNSPFLDGSGYFYNGGLVNPSVGFQWQFSSDNITFTDIAGATSEDYTPTAISTFVNSTAYYRRVVKAVSNGSGCSFTTSSVGVTTVAESSSGPCYPLATTIYNFCIDNNANSILSSTANAGSYANLNVVKGFTYTFSIGNVFAGFNENITILDSATNANVTPSSITSGASGVSVTWLSTLSGTIKILLTKDAFLSDGSTGGPISMVLNSVGNTQDSQTAFGTNQWVGHVYNWSTGAPPGGNVSPAAIANGTPFSDAEYVGYYNVPTQNFSEGFGGNTNCFPVLSNGVVRTNIYTERFAVRYRMKSTLSGCFLASFDGDDGIRIYVDGVLIFSEWKDQAPTNYGNILLTLNGNSDIVVEFYENGGQNIVNFSLTPFAATSNTIAGASSYDFCTGVGSGVLDGSGYSYTGGTVNPTIFYQWQSSTDGTTFTDISGATTEDYTPPVQNTTTTNIVIYYRRKVTAAIPSSCVFFSSAIKITTSPLTVLSNPIVTGSSSVCPTSKQVYSCAAVVNASTYNWVVPAGWIIVSGAGTTSITTTSGTSAQSGTITVTATNGCGTSGTVSYPVSITQPVIWDGSSFSSLPNAINQPLIFNGNYTSPSNTTLAACDCTVNGTAVVTITSGSTMTLQNDLKVNAAATMTFENTAPLVQQNDVVNIGIVKVNRNSSALMRLDYTLWSSPVDGQNLLSFSPLTTNTGPSNIRFYTYNANLNQYDKVGSAGATKFNAGTGYLIRMPNTHPTTPTVWNAVFTGTPNNGLVTVPITYVTNLKLFNVVGNPYPSPISLSSFVAANSANINGTLRFWRKTNSNTSNTGYSTWNGGIFTAGPQFNTSIDPGGVLQTGQGFMVEAKPGATALIFNNSMRLLNTANQFFKSSAPSKTDANTTALDFVWINLLGTIDQRSQMAFGYRAQATNDVDAFDATRFNDSQIAISSIINYKEYTIESRSTLLDGKQDVVPLQVRIPAAGIFTIEMDHVTGFFANESSKVYLKDKANSLIIDLKQSGYSFAAEAGNINSRFELWISKNETEKIVNENKSFAIYKDKNEFVLNSGLTAMANIKVYDLVGRLLFEKNNINTSEIRFVAGNSNEVLIIKTVLITGEEIVKKVMN